MLYISELCEDCAVANEIDNKIDKAWTNIPGIHDNGPRDHGVWRLTLTAYTHEVLDTKLKLYEQKVEKILLMKVTRVGIWADIDYKLCFTMTFSAPFYKSENVIYYTILWHTVISDYIVSWEPEGC